MSPAFKRYLHPNVAGFQALQVSTEELYHAFFGRIFLTWPCNWEGRHGKTIVPKPPPSSLLRPNSASCNYFSTYTNNTMPQSCTGRKSNCLHPSHSFLPRTEFADVGTIVSCASLPNCKTMSRKHERRAAELEKKCKVVLYRHRCLANRYLLSTFLFLQKLLYLTPWWKLFCTKKETQFFFIFFSLHSEEKTPFFEENWGKNFLRPSIPHQNFWWRLACTYFPCMDEEIPHPPEKMRPLPTGASEAICVDCYAFKWSIPII